jgi:hypothetical protein
MHVAPKLSGGKHDLRIRVSGCQNGCAQPESGDIGIYGEGKRQHGKLIPHYQMYFGGDGTSACGSIALKGPSIPAARIEQAITRVQKTYDEEHVEGERFFGWAQRQGAERFQSLLADLTQVSRFELAKLARDHGDAADFRVVSLGGGECASATDVAIGRAFFDAAHERSYREAFVFQRKYEDAAACAEAQLKLVGEGLAGFLGGGKAKELADITAVLQGLTFAEALGNASQDCRKRWRPRRRPSRSTPSRCSPRSTSGSSTPPPCARRATRSSTCAAPCPPCPPPSARPSWPLA